MEEYMKECMKKLALWYTKFFKPIMTHDELEPILATLGFVGLPPVTPPSGAAPWKEYIYPTNSPADSSGEKPPRARLPYPRIDGLHIYTYRAFIDAVNYYLEMDDFSDLFHIRGMPLHRGQDRSWKWRRMEEDESVFVYREGTLDPSSHNLYHFSKNSNKEDTAKKTKIKMLGSKGESNPPGCLVPLNDIVVWPFGFEG